MFRGVLQKKTYKSSNICFINYCLIILNDKSMSMLSYKIDVICYLPGLVFQITVFSWQSLHINNKIYSQIQKIEVCWTQ